MEPLSTNILKHLVFQEFICLWLKKKKNLVICVFCVSTTLQSYRKCVQIRVMTCQEVVWQFDSLWMLWSFSFLYFCQVSTALHEFVFHRVPTFLVCQFVSQSSIQSDLLSQALVVRPVLIPLPLSCYIFQVIKTQAKIFLWQKMSQ